MSPSALTAAPVWYGLCGHCTADWARSAAAPMTMPIKIPQGRTFPKFMSSNSTRRGEPYRDGSNACLMDGDHAGCTLSVTLCICGCHREPDMETLKQDEISRQYQRDGARS